MTVEEAVEWGLIDRILHMRGEDGEENSSDGN